MHLLDIMMPGPRRLRHLRGAQGRSATASIPVLLVSATTDGAVMEQAKQVGAAVRTSKPVRMDELQRAISSARRLRRAECRALVRPTLRKVVQMHGGVTHPFGRVPARQRCRWAFQQLVAVWRHRPLRSGSRLTASPWVSTSWGSRWCRTRFTAMRSRNGSARRYTARWRTWPERPNSAFIPGKFRSLGPIHRIGCTQLQHAVHARRERMGSFAAGSRGTPGAMTTMT